MCKRAFELISVRALTDTVLSVRGTMRFGLAWLLAILFAPHQTSEREEVAHKHDKNWALLVAGASRPRDATPCRRQPASFEERGKELAFRRGSFADHYSMKIVCNGRFERMVQLQAPSRRIPRVPAAKTRWYPRRTYHCDDV